LGLNIGTFDGVGEDARKLGCRNWRANAQVIGRWRHFLKEAKAHSGCKADGDDDDYDNKWSRELPIKGLLFSDI
jgi:hypothetical protein